MYKSGTAAGGFDLVVPEGRHIRGIRACTRQDLSAVAALYESIARSGSSTPPPGLAPYFERTFFDCPWADPEIAPLVYEDEAGKIVGFLGTHVRRLRFNGRVVRICCGGQMVVDPSARARAVGAMLFRTHLWGPQDATITDGSNEIVRGMWEISGGETAHLKSMTWTRVLKPMRYASDFVLGKLGRPSLARPLGALCRPLDAVASAALGRWLRLRPPATQTEPLSSRAILEHMPVVTRSLRCYPDYDEAFLDWVFEEMAEVKARGKLVRSLVRGSNGQVLGWYVYYLHGALSQVMQIAAKRGAVTHVIDDLLHHAQANGSAAVRGRLEPHLLEPLARRKCIFGWTGQALIYCKTPALLATLMSNQSWLERMDGESWMGHHTEPFL